MSGAGGYSEVTGAEPPEAHEQAPSGTATPARRRCVLVWAVIGVLAVAAAVVGGYQFWTSASRVAVRATFRHTPPNLTRLETHYGDCDAGVRNVSVSPGLNGNSSVALELDAVFWIELTESTNFLQYSCGGAERWTKPTKADSRWWSVQWFRANMSDPDSATELRFNTWQEARGFVTSVPFTSETEGYACVKVPALLRTARGTLIAFVEARRDNCSDFAETVLLYRRSVDGGQRWSSAEQLVVPESGAKTVCGLPLVIGNVAPVQLPEGDPHHPGRILAPHMRNNFAPWITHSDDDGVTWSEATEIDVQMPVAEEPDCLRNLSYFGLKSTPKGVAEYLKDFVWGKVDPYRDEQWASKLTGDWQFIGFGPPGSIRLRSGRVLVPGYHSYIRGLEGGNGQPGLGAGSNPVTQLYNNLALGHSLVSDDGGDSWKLFNWQEKVLGEGANELQMVQLRNGSVLVDSRSFSTGTMQYRVRAVSDDEGETFLPTGFTEVPQPFNGCEGSLVSGADGMLFFSGPNPSRNKGIVQRICSGISCALNLTGRDHLTIWRSEDEGASYQEALLVDPGQSGYSSLQHYGGRLGLLYEQADHGVLTAQNVLEKALLGMANVLLPTRIVFREVTEAELMGGHPLQEFQA